MEKVPPFSTTSLCSFSIGCSGGVLIKPDGTLSRVTSSSNPQNYIFKMRYMYKALRTFCPHARYAHCCKHLRNKNVVSRFSAWRQIYTHALSSNMLHQKFPRSRNFTLSTYLCTSARASSSNFAQWQCRTTKINAHFPGESLRTSNSLLRFMLMIDLDLQALLIKTMNSYSSFMLMRVCLIVQYW